MEAGPASANLGFPRIRDIFCRKDYSIVGVIRGTLILTTQVGQVGDS